MAVAWPHAHCAFRGACGVARSSVFLLPARPSTSRCGLRIMAAQRRHRCQPKRCTQTQRPRTTAHSLQEWAAAACVRASPRYLSAAVHLDTCSSLGLISRPWAACRALVSSTVFRRRCVWAKLAVHLAALRPSARLNSSTLLAARRRVAANRRCPRGVPATATAAATTTVDASTAAAAAAARRGLRSGLRTRYTFIPAAAAAGAMGPWLWLWSPREQTIRGGGHPTATHGKVAHAQRTRAHA